MTRYMRDLRITIAKIMSSKNKRLTTIPQYWIIDTEKEQALAFLYPTGNGIPSRWLARKLEQNGWVLRKPNSIIKSSGSDKTIQFNQIVVSKA